jgi:hypothetical protein
LIVAYLAQTLKFQTRDNKEGAMFGVRDKNIQIPWKRSCFLSATPGFNRVPRGQAGIFQPF